MGYGMGLSNIDEPSINRMNTKSAAKQEPHNHPLVVIVDEYEIGVEEVVLIEILDSINPDSF
jgi:hypothetical protein